MSASASLELQSALQAHGDQLVTELRLLSELSQVYLTDGVEPPVLDKVKIISVDSDWVRYGQGRNDKFRNVHTAGGFVINATELRSVNFSMQAVDVPLRFTPQRHGRRAAVLTTPMAVPKRYKMHKDIDSEITLLLLNENLCKTWTCWCSCWGQNENWINNLNFRSR